MHFLRPRLVPGRAISVCVQIGAILAIAACQTTPPPMVGTIEPSAVAAEGQEPFAGKASANGALNAGDKVDVSVFREDDLSIEDVPIAGDGTISMPLIGAVPAAGRTTAELAMDIRSRLASQGFIKNPEVTVNRADLGSYKVTVEGAVTTPGVYDFIPGQRLSSAIALAAGPKRTAKLDQVALFRKTSTGMAVAKFDYRAVQQGTMLDPELQPGDRVVMGNSALGQVWQDLLQSIPVFAVFSNF